MLLQRAPPDAPHLKSGCCHFHKGTTLISFLFADVLTVFELCDILELNSVMWFHICVCVCQIGMFIMFVIYVVVIDLIVTQSCCLYYLFVVCCIRSKC